MALNDDVKSYWEQEACGTQEKVVGKLEKFTREWFERVENHRYQAEPFIHSVAQFTRYHSKKILEVGVGAGTDHLQWARAGAECYGVDLTDEAIETTRRRLETYGFHSNLKKFNAETLPFEDNFFDVIYSWGVIHHTEHPDLIIKRIHRALKPGGIFIGMMYGRYSIKAFRLWLKHSLLKGKPWCSVADVIWNHMESLGTKAYTTDEIGALFSQFSKVDIDKLITKSDTSKLPDWISKIIPNSLGWYITIKAFKNTNIEINQPQ
jgi:ubiquinone/menaquinone biosynthesis C-methylase UbiE